MPAGHIPNRWGKSGNVAASEEKQISGKTISTKSKPGAFLLTILPTYLP